MVVLISKKIPSNKTPIQTKLETFGAKVSDAKHRNKIKYNLIRTNSLKSS